MMNAIYRGIPYYFDYLQGAEAPWIITDCSPPALIFGSDGTVLNETNAVDLMEWAITVCGWAKLHADYEDEVSDDYIEDDGDDGACIDFCDMLKHKGNARICIEVVSRAATMKGYVMHEFNDNNNGVHVRGILVATKEWRKKVGCRVGLENLEGDSSQIINWVNGNCWVGDFMGESSISTDYCDSPAYYEKNVPYTIKETIDSMIDIVADYIAVVPICSLDNNEENVIAGDETINLFIDSLDDVDALAKQYPDGVEFLLYRANKDGSKGEEMTREWTAKA